VEGDGRQSDHIVDKGDSHVSQGGDGVVSVSQIPDLICGGVPVEIEKEIGLGGNLLTRY